MRLLENVRYQNRIIINPGTLIQKSASFVFSGLFLGENGNFG